jgi:hypothetical protein
LRCSIRPCSEVGDFVTVKAPESHKDLWFIPLPKINEDSEALYIDANDANFDFHLPVSY